MYKLVHKVLAAQLLVIFKVLGRGDPPTCKQMPPKAGGHANGRSRHGTEQEKAGRRGGEGGVEKEKEGYRRKGGRKKPSR